MDFSLPNTEEKRRSRGGLLSLLILVLVAIHLGWSITRSPSGVAPTSGSLAPDKLKALATQLEDRSVYTAAAETWTEYAASTKLTDEQRARAYFNAGRLYQKAERPELAIGAYYRSEATKKVAELESDIKRNLVASFQDLGQFAGLRREIEARTNLEGVASEGAVVAELGPRKIRAPELDRLIQEGIDRQLAPLAMVMPPDQLAAHRKRMADRFKASPARLSWLEQYLVEEMLVRESLAQELQNQPEVKRTAAYAQRKLLAQQLVLQEVGRRAALTDSEIVNAYEANKANYLDPEAAEISHILLKTEKEATAALSSISSGQNFGELAKSLSIDKATAERGGAIDGQIVKGRPVPGIGHSAEFTAAVFETNEGATASKAIKTDEGYHVIRVRKKIPARQKAFSEVRDQVIQELSARKQQEFQAQLIERLKGKYQMSIHRTEFKEPATPENALPSGSGAGTKGQAKP